MDTPIDTVPALKAKRKQLFTVRKLKNVKPVDAVEYWGRPDVIAKYGSHAVTVALTSARYQASTALNRQRTRIRNATKSPEEQGKLILRTNA